MYVYMYLFICWLLVCILVSSNRDQTRNQGKQIVSLYKITPITCSFICTFPKGKADGITWACRVAAFHLDSAAVGKLRKATSSVTAHSPNGEEGKCVGRELKHPKGLSKRHLHCCHISPVLYKPRRKKNVGFAYFVHSRSWQRSYTVK